jgi:hypothetical protein
MNDRPKHETEPDGSPRKTTSRSGSLSKLPSLISKRFSIREGRVTRGEGASSPSSVSPRSPGRIESDSDSASRGDRSRSGSLSKFPTVTSRKYSSKDSSRGEGASSPSSVSPRSPGRIDSDSDSASRGDKSRSGSLSKFPNIISRKNSSKDISRVEATSPNSSRSSSPRSKSTLFYHPRPSLQSECNFINGDPVFSLYAEQSIHKKGFLRVNRGDLITFLYSDTPYEELWLAMCNNKKGFISSSDVTVSPHSANIYLSAVDIVLKDPEWLSSLLKNQNSTTVEVFSDIENLLVPLLGARHLLCPVLEKYCLLEQINSGTPYMERGTCTNRLITALFSADSDLVDFSIQLTKSYNLILSSYSDIQPDDFRNILISCVNRLNYLFQNKCIPTSVVMVMNAIKTVSVDLSLPPAKTTGYLGTIFFLFLISPALSKEGGNLLKIATLLKVVVGVETLMEEDELYSFSKTISDLREPVTSLLNEISSLEVQWEPKHSVVDEAADFYYLLMQKFSDHPAIQSLKVELGDKERQFEILARIRLISQFINDNDYLHGKALRN